MEVKYEIEEKKKNVQKLEEDIKLQEKIKDYNEIFDSKINDIEIENQNKLNEIEILKKEIPQYKQNISELEKEIIELKEKIKQKLGDNEIGSYERKKRN